MSLFDVEIISGRPTVVYRETRVPWKETDGSWRARAHRRHVRRNLSHPRPSTLSNTLGRPPPAHRPVVATRHPTVSIQQRTRPFSVAAPSSPSAAAAAAASAGRTQTRLTAASGDRVTGAAAVAHIGQPFPMRPDPSFLADRAAVYDEIIAAQRARLARKPREPIRVTLPDGKVISGVSWETTPLQIAEGISKGLASAVVVARVAHSTRVGAEAEDGGGIVNTGPEEEAAEPAAAAAELWDLVRPLEGDCRLELLKFEDKDGKMVFWHSSAHVLGECLECGFGAQLCIGPPTEDGFYYDAYLGGK
jgi:hypothetical protein